ncbi:stress-activated map kinase interacting protein 1-domain-containing protein [Helicostylum pulchrum]|nr:stress-activated map kinase interacting protein 1-domain-containing protein [Helicostylum pulchrum]
MSLITDPIYLIHTSRIKFLRVEERAERIITFPPTVMSDDYVRLAAPIYPEMQYCYSPVYDGLSNTTNEYNGKLNCSPRTTKRNYRQRKPQQQTTLKTNYTNIKYPAQTEPRKESDSEDDDIEVSNSSKQDVGKITAIAATASRSFHTTSLQPSVDSVIDPSPHSSIENNETSFPPFLNNGDSISQLEYTKKPAVLHKNTSALSALIAEKAMAAENPFAEYSVASGKGESKSIKLCVYLPHSSEPQTPIYVVVRPDAITDDVIGYILYDYVEEKRQPELDETAYDLAEWILFIAEDDGEIEDYLPAVDRTRNIGRVSFDQFALCRATEAQAKQNDLDRARIGRTKPDLETLKKKKEASQTQAAHELTTANEVVDTHIVEDDIASTMTNRLIDSQQQNQPDPSTVAVPVPSSKATLTKATMPMTPLKYFRIKLMTNEEVSATTAIPVYAEMFIGDVLELVSRKRKLDPNEYMLTIADSKVIVPNDTTVESMKGITDLTLTKKGTTLAVPSSTHLWRSPIKRKKEEVNQPMYFSTTDTPLSTTNVNDALLSQYKKYTVSRKMPMFVSKKVYILAIDGDYIHLMPPEHKGMFDSVKTTSFHASAVRSCKQSKKAPANFKVMILKERDFKTYDLEAENAKEANEICNRIRFLVQVTKGA